MLRKNTLKKIIFFLGYVFLFKTAHLIFLTIVTSLHLRSIDISAPTLSTDAILKVDEILQANQILIYGLAATLYVVLLHIMQPLTTTRLSTVFQIQNLKTYFPRHAISGLILTMVLILGGLLAGYIQFLGIYFNLDEIVVSLGSIAVFSLAIFSLILFEEYLLRNIIESIKIETTFEKVSPYVLSLIISTVFFLFLKIQQFELKRMEILNLILLNVVLFKISHADKSAQRFLSSASFFFVFLFTTHIFFGLPLFGQEMPGIILLRCTTGGFINTLFSGGIRGPENSLLFSLCMIVYIILPQDIFKRLPKNITLKKLKRIKKTEEVL